ncbi:MAG: TraR/DksA family transcriptional regulator [Acidobacteria bacterium]|nr:TraR/DksA family transcriptional regulator [Acidobacteriota bacterium]
MEGAAEVMAAKSKKRNVAVAEAEAAIGARYDELKVMLVERQREILNEVQGKIREVRAEGSEKDHEVLDPGETSEVDIQEDIEFALIQMKAETLNKINEALSRLEEGTYGHCFECAEEIAQPRLRALPFAVRCKDCEEAREMAQLRDRIQARRGSSSLGFDMRG